MEKNKLEPDGTVITSFVIDATGQLWIAGRCSEHVVCAAGQPVLAAGEITFMIEKRDVRVSEVSSQSMYVIKPDVGITKRNGLSTMNNHPKLFYIVGTILAGLGSFLPWKVEGDFLPYWTYGVRIYFDQFYHWLRGLYRLPIYDAGGLLVLILSAMVAVLVFRSPDVVRRQLWVLVCSIALTILAAYHIIVLLLQHLPYPSEVGAPTIQAGLIMVSIGSLCILYAAVSDYHKHHSQLALSGEE